MDDKPRKPQLKPEPYTPSFGSPMAPPLSPYTSARGPRKKANKSKHSPRHVKRKSPKPKHTHPRGKKPASMHYSGHSSSTSPSPSPHRSPKKGPPSDFQPKFKAEFFINLRVDRVGKKREAIKVVGDTGCSKSVISEDFFRSSPHLQTRPYRPLSTRGRAINGSKVLTLGIVNVAFRINNRFYQQNFRVVRGLIQDAFLGWDWFSKSGAIIDTDSGSVRFPRFGDSIPLVPLSLDVTGCYYRVPDDRVIPANSKAHLAVEVMLNGQSLPSTSTIVETEPFRNAYNDVWASRNVDVIQNGQFLTEVINAHNYPVKLEKGRVLGYANFTSDNELSNSSVETNLLCHYDLESLTLR